MEGFSSMVKRQRQWMLFLLAIFVLGAGFTSYTRVFYGLLLGGVVSFYNLWLLQRKINTLGKSLSEMGSARQGLGTFSRLAAVSLCTMIALKYDDLFHIIAVVIGIASSYFILGIDIFLRLVRGKL